MSVWKAERRRVGPRGVRVSAVSLLPGKDMAAF